jgi:hypothetical protein
MLSLDDVVFNTLCWDNTPSEQVQAHQKVLANFGIQVKYSFENSPHGDWMDRVMWSSEAAFVGFFDADCVPLSREKILECLQFVSENDSFIGIAQASNHIRPSSHIYAAPAFFIISRSCWERLQKPSFRENFRSDVGQELSRTAEFFGVSYKCLYPDCYEKEPVGGVWPLGNYGFYGIGTVFDGAVYHLYQGRLRSNLDLFLTRCSQIVQNTFDTVGFVQSRHF